MSPAKVLNKIRSNSATTQLQAEKQTRYCVGESINGTASQEKAIAAPLKVQQTLAASKKTTTTTSIAPTNSTQSTAPPKPKAGTTKAKKHKQAKNPTDEKTLILTGFAYSNNKHSATQTKAIAPIISTKRTTPTVPTIPTTPTTPAEPIKPPKPPKTKTESKATGPSKGTAGFKKFSLTKDKNGPSTSTPTESKPGSRTATSAKRASDPKTSKPIEIVQANRKVGWLLGALPF
ncbi:hypothetical protein EC957_011316 [Mortierella hygrophila]|uniref:Uncharacterized protein n=1 Tax=Mortierella hygrophila TaxID=979708 RepID=A0A9P6K3W1_9FUNG|nr:hypothetical protein EC957_011316 [Mortierella hygrophila]